MKCQHATMIGPIVVGLAYSAVVIAVSVMRPNAGRILLGVFFLAMGLGVNVAFALTDPTFVYDYGIDAWSPLYRMLTETIIGPNPKTVAVLLIVFEVTMGLCLLGRGLAVKVGLVGTMLFMLMLIPIHPVQALWAVSIAANIYLLRRDFDTSVAEAISGRLRARPG